MKKFVFLLAVAMVTSLGTSAINGDYTETVNGVKSNKILVVAVA